MIPHSRTTHRTDQARWELPTDCDRLDEAFAALNRLGIVSRQNFSCCTNCGHTDIWEEIAREEQTHTVEGYVFYHFQCIEHAIASRKLLLAYGSVGEGEGELENIGNTIVRELRRAGLDARWDANPNNPVVVEGFVWRRRR